jgi:hypothetical protein
MRLRIFSSAVASDTTLGLGLDTTLGLLGTRRLADGSDYSRVATGAVNQQGSSVRRQEALKLFYLRKCWDSP